MIEFRVLQELAVEIGPKGKQHEQRSTSFGNASQQQLNEAFSLLFGFCLCEEFLELVHQQYNAPVLLFYQLHRQHMQASGGIILQILADGCEASFGKVGG